MGGLVLQDASSSTGACGYGTSDSNTWPFGAVAALSPNASLVLQSSPQAGCGICLEVKAPCSDAQVASVQVCCAAVHSGRCQRSQGLLLCTRRVAAKAPLSW